MAVTVLFGKAGSGKTEYCFSQIKAWADQGNQAILLVPDQATYSVERRFAASTPGRGFMGTQIFGFSRLAFQVFQERGKEHESLSELSRHLILQRLLRQYGEELTVLRTAAQQPNFVTTMGQFLMECRSFCITPEDLKQAAETLDSLTLSHKLTDISILYEKYLAFLSDHFGSVDDTLTLLAKELPDYSFLQGARVWVDGFQWFTPEQLTVLEVIEQHAVSLTITLAMDAKHLQRQSLDTALFHRLWDVYRTLRKVFPQLETETLPDPEVTGVRRFTDGFFEPVPAVQDVPVEEVIVSECLDRNTEIDAIARRISRLVRHGYRYRDFLVLTRASGLYDTIAERIFPAYGIPCFTDYRRPMLSHPAVAVVSSLLALLRSNWSHESVFRLLKTDLFPLSRHEVDILENYCLANGITGRHWLRDAAWTYYYRPYFQTGDQADSETEEALAEINGLRQRVRDLVIPYWQAAQKAKTLRDWCTLLYQFLQHLGVPDVLRQWRQDDDAAERTLESKEHEQVWKKLLAFLNEIVTLCGADETNVDEFSQMVEDGLGTMTFSVIPPTLDHVMVTSIERGYTMRGRIVFVCGLNDGVFPQHSGDEGLLNDTERKALNSAGFTLGPGSRFRSLQERFLFYLSVHRASERVYLSYALADEQGDALSPSLWIQQLLDKGYVSGVRREMDEITLATAQDYIVSLPEALKYLPVMLRPAVEQEPVHDLWWSLYDWALAHGYSLAAKQAVQGLFYHNKASVLPQPIVRGLYAPKGKIVGSVTRFESYRQCPFAYFAQYGLKLEERRLQRFTAPDLGVLVHEALRRMGTWLLQDGRQWHDLKKEEIAPLCLQVVEELSPHIQNDILMSNAYFVQIKGRLIQVLIRTVTRLCEFNAVSNFHMAAVEKGFGRGAEAWPALEFSLPNGIDVIVTGQIDRVDTFCEDGVTYVIIIDYKSGHTVLDLGKIYTGLELQLLTYMDVALRNTQPPALPAAILYCYVRSKKQTANSLLDQTEKEDLYNKEHRMKGFYLDNPELMASLDTSMEKASSFVNLNVKKDGTLTTSWNTVYPAEWWLSALKLAEKRIFHIAGRMADGDISIMPLLLKNQSRCTYCAYHAVCAFDPHTHDNCNELVANFSADELIARIKQEGDEKHGLD